MSKNQKKESSLIWSIHEICNFDKRLLVILLVEIFINSFIPFPNIIFGGIIVNAISQGNDFGLVVLYVVIMFGITYLLDILSIFIGKRKEFLLIKLTDKLVNDLNAKCITIDYEQFNDSATLDRIHSVYRTARGNNFFYEFKNCLFNDFKINHIDWSYINSNTFECVTIICRFCCDSASNGATNYSC